MNREKAGADNFGGEFEWRRDFACFGVEAEFVNAFAGIGAGVGADVNGVFARWSGNGDEKDDGQDKISHGVSELEIGNGELAMRKFGR